MNIRICTPVIGETLDQFLKNLQKTQEVSDFIELRVDYIEGFTVNDVGKIRSITSEKSLFTCRPTGEGGYFAGKEEDRIQILQSAIGRFDYIDIELATMKTNQFTRNEKTKLIISYHNFNKTPRFWDMQNIIHDMNQHSPDIIKIATMVHQEHEVRKLYRLLTNKPHHEERIVVGMGEKGTMTRILGPLLGSYLTYASTSWGESAPGQLQIEEMKKVYNTLI